MEDYQEVEQGQTNIMRIDINMEDVPAMTALVVGLIGIINVRAGNIPYEIVNALRLGNNTRVSPPQTPSPQAPSPKTPSPPIPAPPSRVLLANQDKYSLMDSFIQTHCTYGEGLRIKSTDLRTKFNERTGLNETHVSFSKLMEGYEGDGVIDKKQLSDGKWYIGIGWKREHDIKIPTNLRTLSLINRPT